MKEVAASVVAREAAAVAVARQGMLTEQHSAGTAVVSKQHVEVAVAVQVRRRDRQRGRAATGQLDARRERAAARVERQHCRQTRPLARPRRERKRSRSTPPSRDDDGVE